MFRFKINRYTPTWFAVGFIIGVLFFNIASFWIFLSILLLVFIFFLYMNNMYLYFLLTGIILGYSRIKLKEDFLRIQRRNITFGDVKVVGLIEDDSRKNILKIITLRDAKNLLHQNKSQSIILYGDILPEPGNIVDASIKLSPAISRNIPDGLDPRFKLFFENILGYGKITSCNCNPLSSSNFFQKKLIDKVDSKFSDQTRAFIFAILFGKSTYIDQNFYEKTVNLGVSHLLVVSAMHFIFFSYPLCFISRWIISPLVIPSTISMQFFSQCSFLFSSIAYFSLVKHNWSVIRSFLTIIITILLTILGRRLNPIQIASLTLLIMISIWPDSIFELGFQLSFISVFTLMLLKCNFLTSTLYVNLVTMPFVLYQHGYTNLQPFLSSFICIPFFSFIIMPLISISTLFHFPDYLNNYLKISIDFFIWLVNKLDQVWIIPVHYYITGISLILFIFSLFSWILLGNKFIFCLFNLLSIATCHKSNYPTILIDSDLKTIFYYKDRILYTNQPDSWKARNAKRFFNAIKIIDFSQEINSKNMYSINKCNIIFDKHERFNELISGGVSLVKAWDIIGNRSPVMLVFKNKKTIIKFNDTFG